jgi:site-specific DNA-methyltransferase (adenine-specific)
MRGLADGSVDCVVTDPPYYSTKLDFDLTTRIDFNIFFDLCFKKLKETGFLVTFCDFRLGRELSMRPEFRYELIWEKTLPVGFLNANIRPLRNHEYILIFTKKLKLAVYNPQKTVGKPRDIIQGRKPAHYGGTDNNNTTTKSNNGLYHPKSVLKWSNSNTNSQHPTQKPLEGVSWLINTYSNENNTILDPFMGSGTTGVACMNLNRNFIGYELDPEYFKIAEARIENAKNKKEEILL